MQELSIYKVLDPHRNIVEMLGCSMDSGIAFVQPQYAKLTQRQFKFSLLVGSLIVFFLNFNVTCRMRSDNDEFIKPESCILSYFICIDCHLTNSRVESKNSKMYSCSAKFTFLSSYLREWPTTSVTWLRNISMGGINNQT